MKKIFQALQLVSENAIQPPADYLFDGKVIVPIGGNDTPADAELINCAGLLGSKGWIDLRCFVGEPGLEARETFESLQSGLIQGGFCEAVVLPNTQPVVQSGNEVAYIKQRSAAMFSTLHIQAAVTKDNKGDDFTEMLDLNQQGVTLFGEGLLPLSNSDRMLKALQYLKKFGGVLFDHSYDPLLAMFGQMHEGNTSTLLGLKGIPRLAEEAAIDKNLSILEYTGGRLHFQTVSSAASVEKIRRAKKQGLDVTADVSIYQLLFKDEDLVDFDTSFKVMPPFREEDDRIGLLEGLRDGTIDALVSNHIPHDFDAKFMEFDLAPFGMIGLQTFMPALVRLEPELGWATLIQRITTGPAKVLGNKSTDFDTLTIFDPEANWHFDLGSNVSLAQNSPLLGMEMKGKVVGLLNKGKYIKAHE